jgi:hypothetical protein
MWRHGLDRCGSGHGQVAGTCEYLNEPSGSIKCGEFLNWLRETVSFSSTLLHAVSILTWKQEVAHTGTCILQAGHPHRQYSCDTTAYDFGCA